MNNDNQTEKIQYKVEEWHIELKNKLWSGYTRDEVWQEICNNPINDADNEKFFEDYEDAIKYYETIQLNITKHPHVSIYEGKTLSRQDFEFIDDSKVIYTEILNLDFAYDELEKEHRDDPNTNNS